VTFKFKEKERIDKKAVREFLPPEPEVVTEDVTLELPSTDYKQIRVRVFQDKYSKQTGKLQPKEIPGILVGYSVDGTTVTLSFDAAKLAGVATVKIETENFEVTGEIEP
jgi:hypothetical protein